MYTTKFLLLTTTMTFFCIGCGSAPATPLQSPPRAATALLTEEGRFPPRPDLFGDNGVLTLDQQDIPVDPNAPVPADDLSVDDPNDLNAQIDCDAVLQSIHSGQISLLQDQSWHAVTQMSNWQALAALATRTNERGCKASVGMLEYDCATLMAKLSKAWGLVKETPQFIGLRSSLPWQTLRNANVRFRNGNCAAPAP